MIGEDDHWALKWLTQLYIPGEYDCLDFVREVESAEFSRNIRIPTRRRRENPRIMADQIQEIGLGYVTETKNPRDGDAVLMKPCGTRITGFHIGIYADVNSAPHVLHCCENLGGVLFPIDTIGDHGWEIEGFYRWK